MSLHLKLLDIDHPLTFEESKLRPIEAHALIYLSKDALSVWTNLGKHSVVRLDSTDNASSSIKTAIIITIIIKR